MRKLTLMIIGNHASCSARLFKTEDNQKTKKGPSIERPFGIVLARVIGWEAI
jgi:hypothetical protein